MRKFFLKSVVRATLPVVLVVSMLSGIMKAQVGLCSSRAEQLGSAVAVGSPVLNQNFAEDSWNPYELECFGVYLSNFVEPLTQTYKECFTSGGSGTYALQMSTRNDPENNKVLKGLTDVAVGYQFNHTSALYISIYDENGDFDKEAHINATLRSLYNFGGIVGFDDTADPALTYYSEGAISAFFEAFSNDCASLPYPTQLVFYKEVEGNAKVMFDTTNTYDVDALNALLAYKFNNDGENFSNNFWSQLDEPLAVDSFGNIVLARTGFMVFPACLNCHSTVDGTINYVNRYMMNSFSTGGSTQLNTDWQSGDVYSAYVRGPVYLASRNEIGYGGYPVNYSKSTCTGMFYAQSADLMNGSAAEYYWAYKPKMSWPSNIQEGVVNYMTLNLDSTAHYKALYELMSSDFTMGSSQLGLRYATPINGDLLTNSYGGCWNNANETQTNGFGADNKPQLYFVIQLNSLSSTASLLNKGGSNGGHTPAANVFNEIYFPGKDEVLCTLFAQDVDSWRLLDSQLWAANGACSIVNDQGIKNAEAAEAYINGLAHGVYASTHTTTTSYEKAFGPFYGMGLTFVNNVSKVSAGEYKTFRELTGVSDGSYPIQVYGKEGTGETEDTLKLSWDTFDLAIEAGEKSDPDFLEPQDNYYKIYSLASYSYINGMGTFFSNGLGTFDDVASYIYVTYLNYYKIGRENDEYGVKTAKSDFDPMFFDSNILFNDLSSLGISAPSNEDQAVAARTRMMMLLDPEKGADYRREIITTTLTKFCADSYNKMTGKEFGGTASSALCLQEIADNPFTGWLVDHEVWVILIFTFVALVLASWAAITRGKGWFWAICQIAVGIVGVIMIPFILNAGVRAANFISSKCYSANADVWWLADAVENRYAEVGLVDMYNANADEYDQMGLSAEQMANIVLSSSKYQSITFGQDISNKQIMPLSGLYAHLSQYPSAAWILPTLLDQTTVTDESAGGYTIRVGAFKKLSELETLYWGYYPVAIGDTITMCSPNGEGNRLYSTEVLPCDEYGTPSADGNYWFYYSLGRTVPDGTPFHLSKEITGYMYTPSQTTFLTDKSAWLYNGDSSEKVHLIEVQARNSNYITDLRLDVIGKSGNTYIAHRLSSGNDESDWYLKGTESPLPYFYAVVQDTFYNFNTAQTIDALIGTTDYYGEGKDDYTNLNFLQTSLNGTYVTNSSGLAGDHVWQADAMGADYARDILDLDGFYRYYAPAMYQVSIYTGGSQIGLGEADADLSKDVVGVYGSMLIKDTEWDYPIYENNYASWMFASNWAVKLYENPQNIKLQTVRDAKGNKSTVCPINPYTYPDNRPFITCRGQMECYGLDEGDLSTVELACVQANDEAMLEIIKTINVYSTAPAKLDVNSFKDLLAVKCLSAYANNINQAALTNSKYRIIPNGFEFDGICYDVVFSQMLYNTYRKANAYTVDDVVEGYIADEGPIMALFLTATAALGAVVIPFVLRIGLALLYVVNLWAALNAVIESLEHKASVLFASVVNTASFTIRTCILFVVQAFLMSMGGVGIIVQQRAITFRGSATMLIITLLVFYILYTISIIEFFSRTVQNGNDMGAAYLKANYEMSRDQGLLRFAQHRFAQSWGGKMLNAASRGMLGNEPKTSATGSGTTTSAGGGDTTTSGSGEGGSGGAGGAGTVGNEGGNTIDRARARSSTTLTQAAEKVHANGKDNPAGGSYIEESVKKGRQEDTRSQAFMEKAFGSNPSESKAEGAGADKTSAKPEPKPEKPKEPKPEKPKDDGPKAKI